VVIPAHDEAKVIGRLLDALLTGASAGEFEIVVVANGCSDDTEQIASGFGDAVRVVSTPVPSKYRALRLGDLHATTFPRLYVDADVTLRAQDVRAIAASLSSPGIFAAAPRRTLATVGSSWLVRWYYDVWERLPNVRRDLYGRGVIGVSQAGHERLIAVPDVMGDDLAAAVAYSAEERRIVDEANVVVHIPRTTEDLLRRRVRSLTATAQLAGRSPEAVGQARTTRSDVLGLARSNPALAPKVVAFLALTIMARLRARKPIRERDFTTWLRDESSRA
jgi:glycosyltransferase involved in cell wall biosynthesis